MSAAAPDTHDREWAPAESAPAPLAGEVHVWQAVLDVDDERRDRWWATLDPEERHRAERFRFDRDRRRYIVRHGVLRMLLAGYLRLAPREVRFATLEHGKPILAGAQGDRGIRFNLSHSGELALLAFAIDIDLGVDVEHIDPERADPGVASRFFAPSEAAALAELPERDRVRGFFDCWTRKEAFVKAVGEGLSFPLDAFEVSLAPGAPARLVSVRASTAGAREWSMTAVDPAPDYAGALVVRGPIGRLQRWRLTDG